MWDNSDHNDFDTGWLAHWLQLTDDGFVVFKEESNTAESLKLITSHRSTKTLPFNFHISDCHSRFSTSSHLISSSSHSATIPLSCHSLLLLKYWKRLPIFLLSSKKKGFFKNSSNNITPFYTQQNNKSML